MINEDWRKSWVKYLLPHRIKSSGHSPAKTATNKEKLLKRFTCLRWLEVKENMRIERGDLTSPKGWYAGPWNSELKISVGYANSGIDEPHWHTKITEVYLIARGASVVQIEREKFVVSAGDMLVVELGEAHTFLESTPDYFHFVVHTPGLAGEEARSEKIAAPEARFGK